MKIRESVALAALSAILVSRFVSAGNVPCAFSYDGKAVGPVDPAVVETLSDDDHVRRVRREWRSADGRLALRVTETSYRRFPAREYLPELACLGGEPTAIVSNFHSFEFSRRAARATVRALRGTIHSYRDFEPVTVRLGEDTNSFLQVATEGRSSAQWMPWTGIDFPEGDGIEVAVGWSGAWRAAYSLDGGTFSMDAGMVKTHFRLLPGETLRQPSILVFERTKDVSPLAMQTLIHRFMMEEKCPRDAQGRLIQPILSVGSGGGNKTPEMMFKIIDWVKTNSVPFDCFWVDAGWNGPAHMPDLISNCGNMWYNFVGDWRFNPTVHPDGNLAKVADAAHAAGMRMLLWVEPERCVSDPPPPLFLEHRDWLLPKTDAQIRNKRQLNLNLGIPEAREWALETISRIVRESKLDVYRQDFNLNTLPLWQENDAPDRQGVTEAKYIAGLYRFWDDLRARFPHLMIENCASGGRRLDFEAVSRAHSYCRTDYAIFHRGPLQIVDVQNTTLNTLAYAPFQGSETTPAGFFDDYGFFSSVCAGAVFTPSDWNAGIVKNEFTAEETAWFKEVFSVANRMKGFFTGDFHPLTDLRTPPPPVVPSSFYSGDRNERRWCAYQMHRRDLDAGFAICFRRLDTPGPVFEADLQGIDPGGLYEVETYGGGKETVRGDVLRKWKVELRRPRDFRLLFYRRVRAAAPSVASSTPCEEGFPAGLMLDGDPSTFARFVDSTPSGRPVTCAFTLDAGKETTICGLRLTAQPDRWRTSAPAAVRVTACADPEGRRTLSPLADEKRLRPCFAGESQLFLWKAVKARYFRVEVLDAGYAAVKRWGSYSDWGDLYARRRMGLPANSADEPRRVDIAELELLSETPEDAPVWNARPDRAFPERRVRKDWLLQDFGWDGFAKASSTNGPSYWEACRARRARRLANLARTCPRIVYAKHYTISGDAELSGNALVSDESCVQWPPSWRRGGQLCVLTVNADGTVSNEVLVDCPDGCIRDPDVSHDGRKILFSMRRGFGSDVGRRNGRRPWKDYASISGDDYHLYVYDVETRETKQITFSDPARCCDFEGIWTSGGRIVFESTRGVQVIPCHRNEAANLYVCDADGKNIRRLGYDGGATIGAQELADGRILYTRYEYNDRSARLQQPLFSMNPDGTAQAEYYGNNSRFPTSLIHFRQIPGSSRLLGILGGHHVAQKGKLVMLDRSRGVEGDAGITFVAGSDIRERGITVPSDYDRDPVYLACRAAHDPYIEDFGALHGAQWQNPYPLSEKEWITGFVPEGSIAGTKSGDTPNFGIYWQNDRGERELLAYDPAIECSQPVPLRPRPKARAPRYVPWNPKAAYGTFHVQDVYEGPGLKSVERGTVKCLRVVGIESRPAFIAEGLMYADWVKQFDPFIAYRGDLSGEGVAVAGGTWDIKHVLGEAEVSPDGSCTFEAPACTPVYFQLLDGKGCCVQTMRSWATLMPGESQGCVGCHESKTDAPRIARSPVTKVQRLKPAAGQPAHPLLERLDRYGRLSTAADFAGIHGGCPLDPSAKTAGFSFPRQVQPILDRHCVRCHDGSRADRPDLRGVEAKNRALNHPEREAAGHPPIDGRRRFTESYLALTSRGKLTESLSWPSSSSVSEMLPPYAMGSGRSGVMKKFEGGHHGAKPSDDERRVFACWIDLGVPFGGSYCEATDWTDDERRIYDYHQRKRAAFAESERLSENARSGI